MGGGGWRVGVIVGGGAKGRASLKNPLVGSVGSLFSRSNIDMCRYSRTAARARSRELARHEHVK